MTVHLAGRKFLRAAEARLEAVQLLLNNEFNFEAVYLAGYVAECALKSLLLTRTPLSRQAELIRRRFTGRSGHDLNNLRRELMQLGIFIPADIVFDLLRVSQWSTDMRYETGLIPTAEAETFVGSAAAVLKWVKRSL
ncbi:MAG TPA: HEPN domain-containing protein [Tepidisphaeraceae bacterium]|jgi:HEPN domain-containing protein|nr:HEPN domain-containing protein [Tepidisphaeraceae bacterium]